MNTHQCRNDASRFSVGVRPGRFGGFGILGLLVVMTIILVLYFGDSGSGSYMDQVAETRHQGQKLSIEMEANQIKTLIVNYQLTNDRLPESMEDLGVPAMLDPWHNPLTFTYEESRPGAPTVVIIRSAGPDEEFQTDDDLTSRARLPI